MTTTLTRAEASTFGAYADHDAAGGPVYRFDTAAGIALAKGDPRVLTGVEVLKVGTFYGSMGGELTVDEPELDALVARFVELRDSDVFVPPFRIDHSWSVMGVVGWFTDLRVEQRADKSDAGIVKPYLVGDVMLNATDADDVRAFIAGGKFRNRSSELWPYRTNTGREYPLVFAGCGFVDIPAVEGLAAITLRRGTPDGTTTGGHKMSGTADGTPAGDAEQTDPQGEQTPDAEQTPDGADKPTGTEVERAKDVDAEHDADEGASQADVEGTPVTGKPTPDADGVLPDGSRADTPIAEQAGAVDLAMRPGEAPHAFAARVQAHVDAQVALRVQTGERLTLAKSRGLVTAATEQAVTALLSHTDAAVRNHAHTLLEKLPTPIKLGAPETKTPAPRGPGATADANSAGTVTADELRELRGREFGRAWSALSAEQRKDSTYLEAYRAATGTTAPITV